MSSATTVRVEIDDAGVALLTLDGPERLNAFSAATARALSQAYRLCDSEDTVRAVVLTGAGRAFCSGADMSSAAASFDAPGEAFSASPVQPPAYRVRKLVIAAINGPAIGIGLTLALQCDVRLVAADILLTGRTFTGTEAARLGIASRALPAAEVLPAALELARDVAVYANPASVAYSKRLLWSGTDVDRVAEAEPSVHLRLLGGPDAAEGPCAWRERRPPRWRSTAGETGDPA